MEKQNERLFYISLIAFLWFVCLGLGVFIYYKFYQAKPKLTDVNEKIITLHAQPIESKDVIVKTNYVGHAEAINQVQIVPYISGYLDKIAVKPGQNVTKGELLLTIEDSLYKAKLEEADAAVMQAEATFNYSKDYYDRVLKSGKKAFSEIDIDKAKDDFLQAEAMLKKAHANKTLAQINLGYTKIMAPISGMVGNFDLSTGDYVAPNNSLLLNIVQTNPIKVVFSLTDKEYLNFYNEGEMFKDGVIKLKLANGKTFKYAGQFMYSDNKINNKTNSLPTYAYFENDKNELLPNAYVDVEIYKTFKNSVSVNKNLVRMQPEGYFVNIGRDGKIIRENVQILAEKGNQYIVKNTFMNGDCIITDEIGHLPNAAKINFDK